MACGSVRFVYGRAHTLSFPCSSSSFHLNLNRPFVIRRTRLCTTQSRPSIRMSATNPSEIIEHVVLFKVKPDTDPARVNAMVNNLAALASLDTVLHITAGPIVRNRSTSLTFTHLLHSRYASKSDLDSYSGHQNHVAVVNENVKPIIEDVMAVDWVSNNHLGPIKVPPGSAMRLSFLKVKENLGENEKKEILGVIGGIKEMFQSIDQLSLGENFSPARAKGFSIASIAVFKGINELEGLDSESEAANEHKEKVRDKLDGVVVLDYVVPVPAASQSASL